MMSSAGCATKTAAQGPFGFCPLLHLGVKEVKLLGGLTLQLLMHLLLKVRFPFFQRVQQSCGSGSTSKEEGMSKCTGGPGNNRRTVNDVCWTYLVLRHWRAPVPCV
jgi:hypothetical protein